MHFDTEEGVLHAEGEVVHPLVSSVLYLHEGAVADPTVVLDQRRADPPAARAHVSHPAQGEVLLFPGDRLHCVCPTAAGTTFGSAREPRGRPPPLRSTAREPRRVTLMIGFWGRDVASAIRRAPLSACGPTPRQSRSCSWPALLELGEVVDGSEESAAPTRHVVTEARPAWEAIAPADAAAAKADPWSGRALKVPELRNNHFFARSMDQFVFDDIPEE
jgi:hypothetical protein